MTDRLDPNLNVYRPDLADRRLEGRIEAERFVDGVPRRVVAATAPIRRQPRPDAALDTEALHGEDVLVFEETAEGWVWGQLQTDGYVGWLPAAALGTPGARPGHRVAALRTLVYPAPDFKVAPTMMLSLNSRVTVHRETGRFSEIEAGYVFSNHLAPLGAFEPDWVATARRLVGTTYLWGGRTSVGLDCSGLVQLSLTAAGIPCLRDTYMQAASIGEPVEGFDLAALRYGDLMFWKGHVAIALGDGRMLHANAYHMDTVIEPLLPAVERIAADGLLVAGVRRL